MDYLILRSISSFISGVILSQTGSLTQMTSRNVLASPSTLGFDGLCILWMLIFHSLLIFLGVEWNSYSVFLFGIPVFLLVGWVFSTFIVKFKNIDRLILMGLTFNLLVGGIFSLWQFFFLAFNLPFPIELWFGHFRYSNYFSVIILLITEIFIVSGFLFLKKDFNLFSLGRTVSKNLKLNEKRLYLFIFCAISLGTFAVISLFGAFSFLGLIFPIMARKVFFKKFDLRGELCFGALFNGFAFMFLDLLCYFLPIHGAEIPVGLIAIFVGAVSLIFLLWQSTHWKKWQR